ncbi:MAG: NADH:flavin oxidoreductase [Clostridia bacterium]|nr:NADH:flavin oxidoreductase [Clostridia bacterium]
MLFEPLKVGPLQLKNRVVLPAISDFGLCTPSGRVTGRHLAHYRAFAEGGCGLVITEACAVSPVKDPQRDPLMLWEEDCLSGMTQLAEAIHGGGAAAMVQLIHPGLAALPYDRVGDIPAEEMDRYAGDFVRAAQVCQKAGFDGVELHAAHGYFLNQITELAGDHGYLCRIVREIRRRCGAGFALSVRFGEKDPQSLVTLAKALEAAGADLLDVSDGIFRAWDIPACFPYNRKVWLAKCVKPHVRVPVMAVGRIFDGGTAGGILRENCADLVAVGRGQLCDPAWANKVRAGEIPNPCRLCTRCLWYRDGRLCPGKKALASNGIIK